MRNIICISATLGLGLASPGFAETKITQGCFERDYSDAHLAGQPKQVVKWIRVHVHEDSYGDTVVDMNVEFARQGHVLASGHAGAVLDQTLHCWDSNGEIGCSVDCDGGSFIVTGDDGNFLTLRTDYLMVGETESCGGAVDLAETQGKPVSYRLNRVEDAACEGP